MTIQKHKISKEGHIHIRVDKYIHTLLTRLAAMHDRSISSWIRNQIIKEAQNELKAKNK